MHAYLLFDFYSFNEISKYYLSSFLNLLWNNVCVIKNYSSKTQSFTFSEKIGATNNNCLMNDHIFNLFCGDP